MKSGSNKEVAILQGHRRKRDLFQSLPENSPIKECLVYVLKRDKGIKEVV
jgi:hypothetical protein